MFFENVDFAALELPPPALRLREEVRAFLKQALASGAYTPHLGHTEFNLEMKNMFYGTEKQCNSVR